MDSPVRNTAVDELRRLIKACGLQKPAAAVRRCLSPLIDAMATKRETAIFDSYLSNANTCRKLHLGCGGNYLSGWLNTDYYRNSGRCHLDATKPFPFPGGSFDFVFSEHMIEHVEYKSAQVMISECFRVLRPGGVLRLATPDLQFLVRLYTSPQVELHSRYITWSSETFLQEGVPHDAVSVVNNYMRDWGHRYIYDAASLGSLLAKAGFVDVNRCEVGASTHPELTGLENVSRMPPGFLSFESLVLEATKPHA